MYTLTSVGGLVMYTLTSVGGLVQCRTGQDRTGQDRPCTVQDRWLQYIKLESSRG